MNNSASPPNNALNWFEIPVRDIKNAATFYAKVTGQPLEVLDFNNVPHAIFGAGSSGVHGALIVDPSRKPGAGGTVIYLDVAGGVTAALARTSEVGGKVVQPVTSLGEHGTCALIEDHDGNIIGLHSPKA